MTLKRFSFKLIYTSRKKKLLVKSRWKQPHVVGKNSVKLVRAFGFYVFEAKKKHYSTLNCNLTLIETRPILYPQVL